RTMALVGLVLLIAFDLLYAVKYARRWQSLDQFQAAATLIDRQARSGDVLALPNHDLATIVPVYLHRTDVRRWPTVPARRVEAFDLDVRPSAFAIAGPRIWVVDILSPYDVNARLAFEQTLRRRGYVLQESRLLGGTRVKLFTTSE